MVCLARIITSQLLFEFTKFINMCLQKERGKVRSYE